MTVHTSVPPNRLPLLCRGNPVLLMTVHGGANGTERVAAIANQPLGLMTEMVSRLDHESAHTPALAAAAMAGAVSCSLCSVREQRVLPPGSQQIGLAALPGALILHTLFHTRETMHGNARLP